MKTIIGVVTLGVFVSGLYLLNDYTRSDDGKSVLNVAGDTPVTVEVTKPIQRDITRTVQAPGEVEAFLEVDISAEVVAKILEMAVEEGDRVKKGDLLCRLDDADFRARVRSAEARVAQLKARIVQADAEYEKAERDYRRQAGFFEQGHTHALELADYHTVLIRARAALDIRRHELAETESVLQSVREDLAKTVITAPIDGVVSQLFAKAGEVVITGTMNNPGTRIMVIADLSRMQVRCRVDEADVPLVKEDQLGQIYLQSDMYTGIAGHVLRVATQGTRPPGRDVVTFETLIIVDSDDPRIKPGMNANVEIEVARREQALTLPIQAVVHRKRKDLPEHIREQFDELLAKTSDTHRQRQAEYIKVVFCTEDEVAKAHLVETGISDDTSVEIVRGITLDDVVAVGPYRSLDVLKDGSKLEISSDEEEAQDEPTSDDKPSEDALARSDADE